MVRATVVYLFVALYVAIAAPIGLTWTALTGGSRFIYFLARVCVAAAGMLCGVRLEVRGREKIAPGQTYLFLSNHQCNFDGPILYYASGRDLRALVKQEMMRLPVLSLVLRQVHFVPIDRADPIRARASIDLGAQHLREGLSYLAFPEGTRSRDGQLGPFKKGVFFMAIKAGVPIVPVTLNNSRLIQPPHSYAIKPATVRLVFHDPIPTAGLSPSDRDALIDKTKLAIASALPAPDVSI
jgi:1-acyl-sn-glycerol-3-phosphate acyltransferase